MSASVAAQQRIERALRHIQNAQAELDRACAELSTLRRGLRIWRQTCKLSDQVKAQWYRVRDLPDGRSHVTVDSEPER